MYPTRRFWAVAALCGFLAAYGAVLSRPEALVGVAGVGGWLVVAQRRAVRQLSGADDRLAVATTLSRPRVAVNEEVHLTVRVTLNQPCSADVRVTAALPTGAPNVDPAARTVRLEPGETAAETTFAFRAPIAGRFDVPPLAVDYRDPGGLAAASVERGEPSTLTVEPRHPRNLHIGQGGDRVAVAYGDHPAGRTGSGLTPAELRQYVPGDAASRIDWKATARLDTPHVREFETENDRQTLLLCDHRATMGVGRDGETMLDYVREVALGLCRSAKRASDPIGLYTVGEEGVTTRQEPSTAPERYRSVRDRLLELTPMDGPVPESGAAGGAPVRTSDPRIASQRLAGDGSAFAARLRPFLDSSEAYVQRLEGDPLFETVRRHRFRRAATTRTVLLTDDTGRNQLLETAQFASDRGDEVLVFLTPRVLFRRDAAFDIERAYERYVDFEEFRRELDRLPGVAAFEVGPGDRLDAILASRRSRRSRRRAGQRQ